MLCRISVLIATVPPVWFRLMEPYVRAVEKSEKVDEKIRRRTRAMGRKFLFSFAAFISSMMVLSLIL